jgi:hypothetical protein
MIKNLLFAAALMSLALAVGCAKGGNGAGNGIVVTIHTAIPISAAYVTQSIQFTATVTGTSNTAVAWTITGTACTGAGNPCGTIDVNSGLYQAPATVPNPSSITITATSRADSTARGNFGLHLVDVTVSVTPTPTVNVGHGLVQQFIATASPDLAPQTFTWSCTQNGAACGNFVANTSGVAVYTAVENPCSNCVVVSAVSTVDPAGCAKGCTTAKVTVQSSRVSGTSPYAFRFSGFDSAHHPVAIAGTLTFDTNGNITSGVEDVVINGAFQQYTTISGSYAPSTLGDHNTNNAGKLTMNASGGPAHTFDAVLDSFGNLRMIEADASGTGSGAMEKSAGAQLSGPQKLAFGFTGVDSNGKRVGYVGLLPLDGNGNIAANGMADTNDNGSATTACASPPCSVTGTYTHLTNAAAGTLNLLIGSQALTFDFFVGSGQAAAKNPLTIYAISTNSTFDSSHPMLSGRMVFQDPGTTYDKTALNNFTASHLTGVDSSGTNTLVSLTSGSGDGNGNLSQTFDANNAGTIVAAATTASKCPYTTATGGRYVITMLGTSAGCTGSIPVVLYASGANRGFLLDQSSAAVMTGSMDPQTSNVIDPSQLPGTYAAATANSSTVGATPVAANLILTTLDFQTHNVAGTLYPGAPTIAGTYTFTVQETGTITLTAPVAAKYVIYATDASHFEMIDVDATVTNPSIIFAQQ